MNISRRVALQGLMLVSSAAPLQKHEMEVDEGITAAVHPSGSPASVLVVTVDRNYMCDNELESLVKTLRAVCDHIDRPWMIVPPYVTVDFKHGA